MDVGPNNFGVGPKPGLIGRIVTGRASGIKSRGSLFICSPSVCHSCNTVCWTSGQDWHGWEGEQYLL